MKRAVLSVAAALAMLISQVGVANAQPKPDPKADAAALARVPALAAQAKITCSPTAARSIGTLSRNGADGKPVKFDAIEVACSEGMGYVLAAVEKNGPVDSYDCVALHANAADPKAPMVCRLPANDHPEKALVPYITKAGSHCQPTDARAIGVAPDGTHYYELVCANAIGSLLVVPPTADKAPLVDTCLATTSGNMACKLTTPEAMEAGVKALAAKADAKCAYSKSRYVMTIKDGPVIEVACASGTGFLIVTNGPDVVSTVPCANSQPYQGGCKLTDIAVAQTEAAGDYTITARKDGYDCDVSKYATYPGAPRGKEIVELACKNRPDGAIAIFSGDGKDVIFNCGQAPLAGYNCRFSPVEAAYPALSAQLKADGKGSCVVNGVRPIGANSDSAFLEVSCADGNPGWVISYPKGDAKVKDIRSCAASKLTGVGACELEANKKAQG